MVKFKLLLSMVVSIIGCSPQISGALRLSQSEQSVADWDKQNLRQVILSRSQRFGEVNSAVLGAFTQQDELEIFTEAFRSAEQMTGQLDIRKSDYDIIFITEDTQHSFHLWLDPRVDGGLYTSVSETGRGYKLTEDAAGKLNKLARSLPYTSEQAASNGDVVNMHGKITNLEKWVRFAL
jgi:hypothetical protein